jgi:hypothetical protein
MTDAMLGAGLERIRDGPFWPQKDQSSNEKVPSQRLRGTFKNCQRLILAESVGFELVPTRRARCRLYVPSSDLFQWVCHAVIPAGHGSPRER